MKKSFTLIELIVVIAIIAILAAIIAPNAFKAIEKARVAKTLADLKALKAGITMLYADTGKFPVGCTPFATVEPQVNLDTDCAGLVAKPQVGGCNFCLDQFNNRIACPGCEWTQSNVDAWDGPYIDGNGLDVWQRAYRYDGDYAACKTGCAACTVNIYTDSDCDNSFARELCVNECGPAGPCAPPVLGSLGSDGLWYTCDDFVIKLTLN